MGNDPVSLTVNYVDGDVNQAQLIVANAESDTVTILNGEASDGSWSVTSTSTIATPSLPNKTLLYDVDHDGQLDLLVCNTGSDDVTMYAGLGNGSFGSTALATFNVGSDPVAMFVGTFDRRLQTDLVTINFGSDDVTFIANAFGPRPVTQTISSGGIGPDAAFAIDPGHTGVMDLVVANGGDGHVAVFRGANEGLQLAGVIAQSGVPTPTALAPSSSGSNGFDFFAAGAGSDAALLLHFDLGVASAYLPGNADTSAAMGVGDEELFAQLMPLNESSLDLIAVFWGGGPDSVEGSGSSNLREPSTITTLYAPTEGQGDEQPGKLLASSSEAADPPVVPATPPKVENPLLANVISGVGLVLDGLHGYRRCHRGPRPPGGGRRPLERRARQDRPRCSCGRPALRGRPRRRLGPARRGHPRALARARRKKGSRLATRPRASTPSPASMGSTPPPPSKTGSRPSR